MGYSRRRGSRPNDPRRRARISTKRFYSELQNTPMRRDLLDASVRKHGVPVLSLNRTIKVYVVEDDTRIFYYKDTPFVSQSAYGAFLTIDVTWFPRPRYALKAARKLLGELPTNILLKEADDRSCDVFLKGSKETVTWEYRERSITFERVYQDERFSSLPARMIPLTHDATRYYTPEEKELWAWVHSTTISTEIVWINERAQQEWTEQTRHRIERNKIIEELV
ncbi:MAG: hypothetical protein AAGK02_07005 [Pseudomonadota bacterium]